MNDKAIFTTHVDSKGRLKDGKEKFECPYCCGDSYIFDSSVSPSGVQQFHYECTDCQQEWQEIY